MKKILVMAYAISPTKGSEYSVAWEYVRYMSKHNRLTVLYGASGDHLGDVDDLLEYIAKEPLANVRFIPIRPNRLVNILNMLNRRGILSYTFYFAYNAWHKQAYKKAEKLVQKENFDLIHFVNLSGYREPGYLWKLNLPYIWGPIGGVNETSKKLFKKLSLVAKCAFTFRNTINNYQIKHKRQLKQALKHTNLLLTATTECQNKLSLTHNINSYYLPENSIGESIELNNTKFNRPERYHFIFIGSLIARKGLYILFDGIAKIKDRSKFIIDIVGDGPLRESLKQYANSIGIGDSIEWHGQLPRHEVKNILKEAHLHVVTSLSEGNPTTIWEAMSCGVPTLTLDHCGMHDTICEKCGVKIPINSYEQVVNDIAIAINKLLDNPDRFELLAQGVLHCASNYTWQKRVESIESYYNEAIKKYQASNSDQK